MRRNTDKKLIRELQLAIAKGAMDQIKKRGWDTAARAIQTQHGLDNSDAALAAFTAGGAGAFLFEGFRVFHKRAGAAAGTEWLRLVLAALTVDVREFFKVDLDIFLVGPDALKKIMDKRVGRKVAPRVPKLGVEKQAQRMAVTLALRAATAQLAQIGEGDLARNVELLAQAVGGERKSVPVGRKLTALARDLEGLQDGKNDPMGRLLARATSVVYAYKNLLENRAAELVAPKKTK